MILRCTGFTCNGHGKPTVPFAASKPASCAIVNYPLHEIDHEVCSILINGLMALGDEIGNNISMPVLNMSHKIGFDIYSFVSVSGKCPNHFIQCNIRGSQKHGRDSVYWRINTQFMHYLSHCLRIKLFHHPG